MYMSLKVTLVHQSEIGKQEGVNLYRPSSVWLRKELVFDAVIYYKRRFTSFF